MHVLLLLILSLTFSSNLFSENNDKNFQKNLVKKVKDYNEFKSIISQNDFCFFYLYDGTIFNNQNEALEKTKNNDLEIIDEIISINPYIKKKKINFFEIDYSKENFKKFKKVYNPTSNIEVLCFYKEEIILKEKIENEGLKNSNYLMNLINKAFNEKKITKKRKNKKTKTVKVIHTDLNSSCSKETYSCPTFGVNFGFGMPYYNWPGYYYGAGNPFWGSPYYRPYIGFGATFPLGRCRKRF